MPITRLHHILIKQKLMRQQLHQPRIYQHPSTQRVHNAAGNAGGGAGGVVGGAYAEADCDAYGGGEAEEDAACVGDPGVGGGELEVGEAGAYG